MSKGTNMSSAAFNLPAPWTAQPVKVALVGAGGTGSQLLTGLARLHIALRSLGHPHGLEVGVWDGDSVSAANIGRQLFSPGDIGRNKAIVLVHRLNCFFGLDWQARPERFQIGYGDRTPDLLITCVDSARARREIAGLFAYDRPLWLDCGNSQKSGQVMLGRIGGPDTMKGSDTKFRSLPLMSRLLPELFDESIPEDDKPSCSLAEALESQDLFINQAISTWAGHLLWTLFREGQLGICGYWINLEEGRVTPVPIPAMEALNV